MSDSDLKKIKKTMLWIIPGMLCAIIGDYCMGIEPLSAKPISGLISSGWLTISDWRITVSNIGGLLAVAMYTIAVIPFIDYLRWKRQQLSDKGDQRLLSIYIVGLILGIMSFLYFHLACGTLIHRYTLIYEAAGGDEALAVSLWNRSYLTEAVPYWSVFIGFGLAVSGGWVVLVLKGLFPLRKTWALAAPLIVAGFGFLLEFIIPWPFNGFSSGFESFGWIVMFLGGRKLVEMDLRKVQEG
ncbi:MAG: hypothetical protein IJI83_02810 [Oscillospiraceae bacterium]|nr:hypothetical protein [Oscillospiraceae bacterium]